MKLGPSGIFRNSDHFFLSPLTIGYGIYIIVSAAFMRQVWQFLTNTLGERNLHWLCINACLFVGVVIILYVIKSRLRPLRVFGIVLILIASFFFSWRQPYFVEKLHVLEYAVLGWLAMRDLSRGIRKDTFKTVFFAFLFILLIGGLDEGFQKLLPYRVGEIRDCLTNIISGSFGLILFILNK